MKKKLCTAVALVMCMTMLLSAFAIVASVAVTDKADPFAAFSQILSFNNLEAEGSSAWPNPTYTEMDTAEYDVDPGSLTYTTSEDGSTVTIEYMVNGEKVSYTVPNDQNYLFGGYSATDDLGRPLYDSSEVGSYGSKGDRYVGLFYFLWHGEHGDKGIFDLQKIIDQYGASNKLGDFSGASGLASGAYGPQGAMHWFAEPLYGYYYARDTWVMRKHVELLTNAGVDFLYIDVTNGVSYYKNAIKLIEILHEFNEMGYDAPQIVFYTHSGSGNVVRELYNNIYGKNLHPDTWFRIDGKPVIIAEYEDNINDFFHIKLPQWPNETRKENGWPWMDFGWPNRPFKDTEGNYSAISVSIAQHSGSVHFTSSSLYGDYSNRGRSFDYPRNTEEFLKECRERFDNDPTITNQGLNFQYQWDQAHTSADRAGVQYVLVTGWNEWVAQRQPSNSSEEIFFVDTASMEFSRDAEMMRGGYFDNYYMQLTYNIQKLKGTAPVVVQDSRKPINVTGEFDQWNDVIVTYTDPAGDTVDRNCTGFGLKKLTDTTGRNDIVASKVTSDSKNIYFYVETKDEITMYDTNSTWMQLFINMDREQTGWYGFDYIINYSAKDAFTTTVAKYNGDNGAFSFEEVGEVSYRVKGNQMMIAVPLSMLGTEAYRELEIDFKWADSDTTITTMEQFYCEGDAAPLGRMNYTYQNYIKGVSEITYPELETEAPTETETEIETESDTTASETTAASTEANTQHDPEEPKTSSCASSVSSMAAVAVISLSAALMIRRRKEQ